MGYTFKGLCPEDGQELNRVVRDLEKAMNKKEEGLLELLLAYHYLLRYMVRELFLESGYSQGDFNVQLKTSAEKACSEIDGHKKQLYAKRDFKNMIDKLGLDFGEQDDGSEATE